MAKGNYMLIYNVTAYIRFFKCNIIDIFQMKKKELAMKLKID